MSEKISFGRPAQRVFVAPEWSLTHAAMISRSAYAQLDYSPLKLIGAVIGLALVYAAPPLLALFADGPARVAWWIRVGGDST